MPAYLPVPEAPDRLGWSDLEQYLLDVRLDSEWSVAPSFETLGRLTALRSDLETDISYLTDLREQLDGLVVTLVSAKRDGDDA